MVEAAEITFTADAVEIIEGAEKDAREVEHSVSPSHLLLSLARRSSGETNNALLAAGLGIERLKRIEYAPPQSGELDAVYAAAMEINRSIGVPAVDSSGLLIALLRHEPVQRAIVSVDLNPRASLGVVEKVLDYPPEPAAPSESTKAAAPPTNGPESGATPEAERLETVPTHADRPAQVDLLGRSRLAQVLAERLRRMRGENTDHPEPRDVIHALRRRLWPDDTAPAPREEGAFLVHLHAPWGAGKTSLLNFLREELTDPADPDLVPWVVVDFSAWRHQRVPPPWWWLLSAMRNEGRRSLWRISKPRAIRFWIRDLVWRLWNARFAWLPIGLGGALLALAFALDPLNLDGKSLSEAQVTIGAVAAIVGFAVTAWGLVRGVSGWLLVGSAPIGSRVLQRVHDPLHMIRRRFGFLVRRLGHPVAVFIDDLDRCDPDYVVELLEGIQTLFMEEPVSYVVAADRRWVCESYAKVYGGFEDSVSQPGRPLGYLFLEKTFQLSIELPPMSPTSGKDLWKSLVSMTADPEEALRLPKEAREIWSDRRQRVRRQGIEAARIEFSGLDTEAEVLERVEEAPADVAEFWRQAAVRRLGSVDLERALQHMLLPFYPLLENNPRGMKRLVNAYGFERARHVRDGTVLGDDARARLVLWTIVKLRWPLLAEKLIEKPALVDVIRAEDDPEEVCEDTVLLRHPAVRNVFNGEDRDAGLSLDVDLARDDVFGFATGTSGKRPTVGA